MSKSRWVRICSAVMLSTQVLALARPALAVEEAARFNFSDTSVGAAAASDSLTQSNGAKLRSSPIGSSGTYSTAIGIDVPPGRLSMTPSLGLSYTSADANRDSAVGAGWSLTIPRISRSTRLGMPNLVDEAGTYSYDASAPFDSPSGELVSTVHGPETPGRMFAPKRESGPVRYEYLDDVSGGRWIEHLPNGHKRYYGADPFAAQSARIKTELGTFAWLLLREEDPFGNDITYRYHNIEDQDRPEKHLASRTQVLKSIAWGGHRPSGLAPAFVAETVLGTQEGPLSALDGNTLLTSRVDRIRVSSTSGTLYWSYVLGYSTSVDSGRPLLTSVTREAPLEPPFVTTFAYSQNTNGLKFGPTRDLAPPLRDEFVERRAFGDSHPYDPEWNALDTSLGQHGLGSGFQFANLDGQNGNDAVYLPVGISAPQSLLSGAKTFLLEPGNARPLAASGVTIARDTLLKSLADMDGDGDLDGVSFPLAYKVAGINGPSFPLRDFSPMAQCLSPDFWKSCEKAEPYRPSVSNMGDASCRGVVSGCLTPHFNQPQAATVGKQLFHIARNSRFSGSPVQTTSILNDWPESAFQQLHIVPTYAQPGPAEMTTVSYAGKTIRDFQAPVVDINGDGKPDVVLLKQRVHSDPFSETLEGTFRARVVEAATRRDRSPDALLDFLAWFRNVESEKDWRNRKKAPELLVLCDRLNISLEQVDAFWTSVVYEDILQPLYAEMSSLSDDDYVVASQHFVDIYGSACEQRSAEYPPAKHMSIRNAPSPFVPGGEWAPGGPMGPLGGAGPIPGNPVDPWTPNRFGKDPRDWCGTMWGPKSLKAYLNQQLTERFNANGGVLPWSEDARTIPKEVVKYVPRVYLAEESPERRFFHEAEPGGRVGSFGKSLRGIFNRGQSSECTGPACEYPPHRNFTSLLMDVNGDGLADIVRATPPARSADGIRTCVGGHKVELNRGYVWNNQSLLSPELRYEATTPFEPLSLLKNRDGKCVDMPDGGGGTIPISAMASVDINADGRLDWVIAYERRDPAVAPTANGGVGFGSTMVQEVFLNTGRGYRHSPSTILPPDFALSIFMAPGMMIGDPLKLPNIAPFWPDAGRLVDIDGDGLLDIAQMGYCRTFGAPPNMVDQCPQKGRWRRNLSVVPDLLTAERSARGSETQIAYTHGEDPSVVTGKGSHSMVVQSITHLPRPYVNVPGLGLPAYGRSTFRYENFTRDAQSPDVIGFEGVTTTAQSFIDGTPGAAVTTTDTYDVREQATSVDGVALPTRYPFRGAKVRTESSDGAGSVATTYVRGARIVGNGVRLEEVSETTRTCASGVCADSQIAILSRDALGFVTESVSGRSNGVSVLVNERDTQRMRVAFEHRTDARWQLGLPVHKESRGTTETFAGEQSDVVLASSDTVFGARGEVLSTRTPEASTAGCAPPGPSVSTFDVDDFGLVARETGPSGLVVARTFDAHHLYVASTTSTVRRYSDGEVDGTTALSSHVTHDLRHGEQLSYTDPNGHTWTSSFDSRGRMLEERIPGGARIRWITYGDTYPSTEHVYTVTDEGASAFVEAVRYSDGDGQSLATIEGRGTVAVPWVRKDLSRYDGFGRRFETFSPMFVGSTALETYAPGQPKTVTELDGFDRVTAVTRPDGARTTFAYTPYVTTETNPRGMRTVREQNDQGQIVRVARQDAAGATVSEHRVFRDSLGTVVRVVDGDGHERHLERDSAGRLTRYDLPHTPGVSSPSTLVCHDAAGQPTEVHTPAGRTVTTKRDEAGRLVALTGTDASGATVRRTTDYDRPTNNGLGRIARTHDATGTTRFGYDALTRPAEVSFEPSAELGAGLPNVAQAYTTTLSYSAVGGLKSFSLTGLRKPIQVRYTRDEAGRTRTLTSDGRTLVSGIVFDAEGRIVETQLGNGTSMQRAYDPLTGTLRAQRHLSQIGTPIEALAYDYDAADNVVHESRSQEGALVSQKSHVFDAMDRLASTELWIRGQNRQHTYSYSAGGNIQNAAGAAYTYAQPSNPQAVSSLERNGTTERALSYGPDGEATTDDTLDPQTGLLVHRVLETDALGCLTHVSDPEQTTELFCGAGGSVAARRTTSNATGAVSARIDVGGIGELRPNEGIFLARIPLGGTTTVEEAYSLDTGNLDTAKSGYIVADTRGSTLARLGYSAGEVKSHETEYDAWGDAVAISALPRPNHAYTSSEPDPGTGYYHYGPRNYDPKLRRWLSPDPLIWLMPDRQTAWGEQLNLYGYASNNPARWTDITGLEGPSFADKLRSLAQFTGAAVAGAVYGAAPLVSCVSPPPAIATDTKTDYAKEHRVGFATGELAGGIYQAFTGGRLATNGAAGEIGTGGGATAAAVPAIAIGSTMVVAGAVSVGRATAVLYHEATGDPGQGGGPTPATGEARGGSRGNRVSDKVQGRPTPEQQALTDMAKLDSRRVPRGSGPVSAGDADAYVELANEAEVPVRAKPNDLGGAHGYGTVPPGPDASHIHVNGEHVPVPPGYQPPAGSTVTR